LTTTRGALRGATGANKLQPCHWARGDTQARCSIGRSLALGGLGDEVVIEEHSVARCGSVCIQAAHPVDIHVDRQLREGGRALQVEADV
jgi:hypothetical protein